MADERSVVPSLRNMALTIAVWPRACVKYFFVTCEDRIFVKLGGRATDGAPKPFFRDVNLGEDGKPTPGFVERVF